MKIAILTVCFLSLSGVAALAENSCEKITRNYSRGMAPWVKSAKVVENLIQKPDETFTRQRRMEFSYHGCPSTEFVISTDHVQDSGVQGSTAFVRAMIKKPVDCDLSAQKDFTVTIPFTEQNEKEIPERAFFIILNPIEKAYKVDEPLLPTKPVLKPTPACPNPKKAAAAEELKHSDSSTAAP